MAKREDELHLKGNEEEKEHILESLILDWFFIYYFVKYIFVIKYLNHEK